jgi:hypothetical protein
MSVNIISLNQMVDLFSGFADRHYFLNDFGFGPTSEIGTSRQMDFPYMWVSLNENSLINPQNRTAIPELSFSVLFMDKTNIQSNYLNINGDNSNNVQEILSDMLQVLQDFITEVQVDWGNYGIIFQDTISCFPATDETQDKVNGWVGQFSFKLKHSNCILPTGDITQTNLSPINPMTRYLTCETLTACTSLQQYIAEQLAAFTGGTASTLQEVTDNGNTTTNDIQLINDAELIFGAGGGVLLDNTSRLREGTIDAGTGGSKGIAQICAVGYELKWEAGSLYVMNGNGNNIREVRYTFTTTPTVNDDITKGFITDSRWVLDNGDIYVCSDPTTGAAVWNLLITDTFVTGGTYSNGIATFSNNSGGTFNVSGFYTGGTDNNQFVTGFTYNNNTFTIGDNSGNTFNATINTMTGLTINGNLDVTSIDDVDYIDFNTAATVTNAVGRLHWNNTDGTLDLGLKGGLTTLQIGEDVVIRVVNGTGGNLLQNQYRAVKVIGAQGQRLQVGLAQANNDANSANTLGLVGENINNNQEGFIYTTGIITKLNTTGSLQGETWNDGDILYLSPTTPGVLTNIKPVAPQHTVILGFVVYAHNNNGKIYVKVDNGYELDELHNVQLTGTTKGGSSLTYNTSTSVWVDSPIVWTIELINALSVDVYAPYNLSIDTVTNILNSPTITIYDDNVLYTLGNTIAVGSKITVVASSIGVTNLTLSKI